MLKVSFLRKFCKRSLYRQWDTTFKRRTGPPKTDFLKVGILYYILKVSKQAWYTVGTQ